MVKLKGKGGRTAPLDNYQLEEGWWQRGDLKTGSPFVGGAIHNTTGVPVVVKQWQRQTTKFDDVIREIWRDEVRQLNRLKGLPKASTYLAVIRDAFEDTDAFTLVLDCGDRVPIAHHMKHAPGGSWISTPRTIKSRIRLWREITRLANAISILHAQGLLHRNIDEWSVMTAAANQADFLLTGFEWSMRLSANLTGRSGLRSPMHSFYEDWRALGNLISWIFNIPSISKKEEKYRADPSANTDFLSAPERNLLRTLIAADPLVRLDGEAISEQIDKILTVLDHQSIGVGSDLVLALPLDAQQAFSKAIRVASGNSIALGNYDEQRRFIADALSENSSFVQIKARTGEAPTYRLSSAQITFELRPFARSRSKETTWSIAVGGRVLRERPAQAEIDQEVSLDGWAIDIIDLAEARRRAPRIQGRSNQWLDLIGDTQLNPSTLAMERSSFSGLMLVQVVDVLWRATQIWPVRKVSFEDDTATGSRLVVEGRNDKQLMSLSKSLGLPAPTARLLDGIKNETLRLDGEWQLSSELALGRVRSRTSTWRFVELRKNKGQTQYVFESSSAVSGLEIDMDLYLQVDGAGYDALVERKLNALKALREHSELMSMIEDPSGDIRQSRDDPDQIRPLEDGLDESKIAALREAWGQLPLYLVQGPPGVGKTRLVRAIVSGRLANSPMDRILLSAQNHSTVDHLVSEIKEAVDELPTEEASEIFPLRSRAIEAEAKTEWDRENQARKISGAFGSSPMAKSASLAIRKKIKELTNVYGSSPTAGDSGSGQRIDRSFESLLLRSANLVFSSTNSGDLARLLEEGAQFDWSIMEESGKATGLELIAPLMLSHRRLLIGDHLQLPAFDAARLTDLLSEPGRIREAMVEAERIISPVFRKLELDETLEWLIENLDERICAEAVRVLTLFETLILPTVITTSNHESTPNVGRQLLIQHRMHPVIGELISTTFYSGKISTFPAVVKKYEESSPPVFSMDTSRLPDAPIVFIDMPYVQTTVGMKVPEAKPSWTNETEAQACKAVLSLLSSSHGHQPSLAVLSPYRRQVNLLRRAIEDATPKLHNLNTFKAKVDEGFFGTVDSFQGNEADVVVVSLVRNNSRTGSSALGFLSQAQRVNVLLSRAKWRLVVIGSLDFLRACVPTEGIKDENDPLAFLDRLLKFIDPQDGKPKNGIEIVPYDSLMGRKS